jgi:hypothetical protein
MLTPTLSTFIFKTFKGFFKKKLKGEFYICFLTMEDGFLLFQFLSEVEENKYIVSIINAGSTRDEKYIDEILDMMEHDNRLETVEIKTPVKIIGDSGITIKFTKPSKVFLQSISLYQDSRLQQRHYMADTKMKGDNQPITQYKIGADFGAIKAMSTVTKGFFIKNILKNDKVEMPSAAKKLT